MQPQPNEPRKVKLEIPANLIPTYANAVVINQTHSEIIMDMVQIMPNDPRARVVSRIVMTPANAKSFLKALGVNLDHFERTHGEIILPSQPVSLADQLFGGLKPEDEKEDNAPNE
jgi:hypothetical protein